MDAKLAKRQSPVLLFIGLGVIILVVILGMVYPKFRISQNKDLEIADLKYQIEKQKVLFPVYSELFKRSKFERPPGLPFPDRKRLPREDIGRLPDIFFQAAQESKMDFERVLPNVNSLNMGSGLLQVDVSIKGEFGDLRNFLMKLGAMPFVDHVERIRIQRAQHADIIGLKVWMILE